MTRLRAASVFVAGIVLLAAALLAWRSRPNDGLLARATLLPVAPITTANLSVFGLRWCETGELFAWTNGGVARIHPTTGRTRPVVAGGRALRMAEANPQTWKVTPDGRWIIYNRWRRGGGVNGNAQLLGRVAARVDGTVRFALPQTNASVPNFLETIWFRDGNDWQEAYTSPKNANVLSVATRVVTAPGRRERIITLGPMTEGHLNEEPILLGRTNRDKLLLSPRLFEGISGDKDFWEHTLDPSGTRAQSRRHFKPRLPVSHACVTGLVLSPRGDRLAWRIYEFGSGSRMPIFLQNVLVRLSRPDWIPRERPTVGLWVSSADGSNLRLIGRERTTEREPRGFDGLCWSPNGKRLLFRLDDRLYTVSATR